MADKLTPLPTASIAPLAIPEASMGNPPPINTTAENTLIEGFKLEEERYIGDFMSRYGWTSTPKSDQSSSTPQSSSPSFSQPDLNEQPQIPPFFEFEKLMFQYLMK